MSDMQCCRTCLATGDLNPIFHEPINYESYSKILFLTTGLKVTINMNDNLPQLICIKCVKIINNHIQFLERCFITEKTLIANTNAIKTETDDIQNVSDFEIEPQITCSEPNGDISNTNVINNEDTSNNIIQFESTVEDVLKNYEDIGFTTFVTRRNVKLKYVDLGLFVKKNCSNEKDLLETHTDLGEMVPTDETDHPSDFAGVPPSKKTQTNMIIEKKNNKEKEQSQRDIDTAVKKSNGKESGPWECKYCKKVLKSKSSLYHHCKTHLGAKIICEHCGKRFLCKRRLLRHCKAKHGYEKTDKCSYCDYTASTAELVKIHERLHTGERPFACSECGARFHRKSSYLQHVAIHLPEKTVQCDQCPARFKSTTLMKIHKQRHRAPSFRFRCGMCGNTFARRVNVARHLANVHSLSSDPKHIQRLKI